MSKQSKINSFFKAQTTADELEVEELLFTQASRASRATTMAHNHEPALGIE